MVNKKKEKEAVLSLTWPNVWVCIITISSLFGTMFMAGIKVESEAKKLALIKQEQVWETKLTDIKTQLRSTEADLDFYKTEYTKSQSRLNSCILKQSYMREEFESNGVEGVK